MRNSKSKPKPPFCHNHQLFTDNSSSPFHNHKTVSRKHKPVKHRNKPVIHRNKTKTSKVNKLDYDFPEFAFYCQ